MFVSQGKSQRLITQRGPGEDLVGGLAVVDLGTVFQKNLANLVVTVLGGEMQCGVAAVVDLVDVGAAH